MNKVKGIECLHSDMSDIEKSKLIQLLIEQRDDLKRLLEETREREEKSSRKIEVLLYCHRGWMFTILYFSIYGS